MVEQKVTLRKSTYCSVTLDGGGHLVLDVLLHALFYEKDAHVCRKEKHHKPEEAQQRLAPLGREDLAECVDFETSQLSTKVLAATAAIHSNTKLFLRNICSLIFYNIIKPNIFYKPKTPRFSNITLF